MRRRMQLTIVAVLLGVGMLWLSPVRWDKVFAGSVPAIAAPGSVEERRISVNLEQERAKLQAEFQQRSQQLDQREIELKTLTEEVEKKLTELQKMRESLQQLMVEKNAAEAKRIKELSMIYAKMSPAQAALLLAELDQKLAVAILAGLSPKVSAKIMDNLPTPMATKLSVAYATLAER
ncbi:MAG: hypothetical protein HGA96_08990 [Desulfobulbaceae bacterium]|nr:hypothetical protein [Desulfobulbaceae bacterium]